MDPILCSVWVRPLISAWPQDPRCIEPSRTICLMDVFYNQDRSEVHVGFWGQLKKFELLVNDDSNTCLFGSTLQSTTQFDHQNRPCKISWKGILQHKEHSQYFISVNGVWPSKNANHCHKLETHITLYTNYISIFKKSLKSKTNKIQSWDIHVWYYILQIRTFKKGNVPLNCHLAETLFQAFSHCFLFSVLAT